MTTPDLSISFLRWSAPREKNGLLDPENDAQGKRPSITLVLGGDPGRQAKATVDSAGPAGGLTDVPLVEDRDSQGKGLGIYRGSMPIPEGTSRIVGITVVLSDEAGHSVSAQGARLPADFSGGLSIKVEPTQEGAIGPCELKVWSETLGAGASLAVSEPGEYVMGALAPQSDYTLTLKTKTGTVLAKEEGVTVSSGSVSRVVVIPQLPATFSMRVVGQDGNGLNTSVVVTLADGTPFAQGYSSSQDNGRVGLTYTMGRTSSMNQPPLTPGTQLVVTVVPATNIARQYTGIAGARYVLSSGPNEIVITLPARPQARLHGRVTTSAQAGSTPLSGATITAYQTLDGQELFMGSSHTASDGNFSFDLLAGEARLVVNHRLTGSKEIKIDPPLSPSEERLFNVEMPLSKLLTLEVYTKRLGQPEFLMDMDWRVAVHLRVSIRNLGQEGKPKDIRIGSGHSLEGRLLPLQNVYGGVEPGDRLEITADGLEAGMSKDTVIVTLDENCWARAEIHLVEKGAIKAIVRDVSGNEHPGVIRYAELFKVGPDGPAFVKTYQFSEEDATLGSLDEGTYTAVFHWDALPSVINVNGVWMAPQGNLDNLKAYLGDNCVVADNLTFQDGAVIDLGVVSLPSPSTVQPGLFRGKDGNDLVPSRYEAGPGSIITMRGSYRYDGGSPIPRLRLYFGVPQKAKLVEGSVVLTPTEGPTPQASSGADAMELSFGDSVTGPLSGSIIYRVEMPGDPDSPSCTAKMWAKYGSGRGTTEDITAVTIEVPFVSLTAPSEVWNESRVVAVSGKATPNAAVRIYDGGYFLADTRASSVGTWQTTVVLPDRGQPANHFLRAEVTLASTATDTQAPSWPTDAALTVLSVGREKVSLAWPKVSDSSDIRYVVTAYLPDGSVGLTRTSAATSFTVEGLTPGTSYTLKVQALDDAGNWSEALSASAVTNPPDTQAPSWPDGASLTASEVKLTSLRLSWPLATDNEGVKEYRLDCSPPQGNLGRRPALLAPDVTTFVVEGLSRGGTYVFTLQAIDASGNASRLGTALRTLSSDMEAPVWPDGASVTATEVRDTDVTLGWTAASDNVDVFRYSVSRQNPNGTWSQIATYSSTTGRLDHLIPETTYTFKIDAEDESRNRTASGLTVTVTTPSRDRTPPVFPPGAAVTVSEKTQDGFRLSWPQAQDASGIERYHVRFWDESLGSDMIYCTSGPSLRIWGLERGKTYSYRVIAIDTRGNQTKDEDALRVDVLVQPEDLTPPSWPQGSRLDVPEVGLQNAELSWTPATFAPEDPEVGLAAYQLTATDGNGNRVFGTTVGRTIREWAVGNLQPGRIYTLKVEAIDRWGNVSTDGPSQVIETPTSDTQAPRWPQDAVLEVYRIQESGDGKYTVMMQWPQAKDFELHHYVITAVDGQGQPAPSSPTDTQQTAWHMWGLDPGKTYTIRVSARDTSGNTAEGPIATVITPGPGAESLSAAGGSLLEAQNGQESERVISSQPVMVRFDPKLPHVTKMTMRQRDGRRVEFEPVGKFPYVFVPGMSFDFDVDISDPTRVEDFRIHADNEAELKTPGSGSYPPGKSIRVTGMLSGKKCIPGRIMASYIVAPAPWSRESIPAYNEEVERSALPSVWRDATVNKVPYDDGNQDTIEGKVQGVLGDPRFETNVAIVFSPQANFTPGPRRDGAPPVYDLRWNVTPVGNDKATFEVTCVIPAQEVIQPTGEMAAQGWLDTPAVAVKIFGETAVHGGLGLADLLSTVSGMTDYQNYSMDLDDLLDGIDPGCPDMARYRERIELEKESARYRTYTKAGLSLLSLALGVAIPGIGFAIGSFVVGKLVEAAIDSEQDEMFNDIKNDIDMNDFCKPKKPRREKKPIADPTWILDPSGYVYEVVPENRLEGVTATALQKAGGAWTSWDASWFEQENPLTTDAQGRYAWDVPEGDWKVSFEKFGYESTESQEMHVPPPHTDVNVAMVSIEGPSVEELNAAFGGEKMEIRFNKYMKATTVTSGTITVIELDENGVPRLDDAGAPIMSKGMVQAVSGAPDPNDPTVTLSKVFRFTPDLPLTVGAKYRVRISQMVQAYNDMSMTEDFSADVRVTNLVQVDGVRLNKESAVLIPGETLTLVATVSPDNASDKSLEWSSSNEAIASVDSRGKVTAAALGACTITVTTLDGGFKDTCDVTVQATPPAPPPPPPPAPPGEPGSSQPSSPPASAGEGFVVGPGATIIGAFKGLITLHIPEGAFISPTVITVRKIKPDAELSDSMLRRMSSTYEIDLGGVRPLKKLKLSIRYCPQCLMDMDPRKLGLFKEDPARPGFYAYAGGILNSKDGSVEMLLGDFSRYAVLAYDRSFEDLNNHWARTEVEILASRQLVNGVSATKFEPDRLITRAELAKLLVSMLSQDPSNERARELTQNMDSRAGQGGAATFTDVDVAAWYYPWVEAASKLRLVQGDGGTFRPNDPVTRQEMAVMIARALGAEYVKLSSDSRAGGQTADVVSFNDAKDISDWALDSAYTVWFFGLMKGTGNGRFEPKSNTTRSQAAAVVLRTLELLGLVTSHTTLQGTLSLVEIEGRHFELRDAEGNTYVLLPVTESARKGLEAVLKVPPDSGTPLSGSSQKVTFKGILSEEASQFMRGQIFKVLFLEGETK